MTQRPFFLEENDLATAAKYELKALNNLTQHFQKMNTIESKIQKRNEEVRANNAKKQLELLNKQMELYSATKSAIMATPKV